MPFPLPRLVGDLYPPCTVKNGKGTRVRSDQRMGWSPWEWTGPLSTRDLESAREILAIEILAVEVSLPVNETARENVS